MFRLSAHRPVPSKCQNACFSSSRTLFSPTICSNKSCTIGTQNVQTCSDHDCTSLRACNDILNSRTPKSKAVLENWNDPTPRHSTNFSEGIQTKFTPKMNSVPKLGENCGVDSWLYHNLCKLLNICTLR